MGRPKKKPEYNANCIDEKYINSVAEYYCNLVKSAGSIICNDALDDESLFKYITETAAEFQVTPMKMRKLLITAGVYSTDASRIIRKLHVEGKSTSEIQAITGLKKSSINGYLPYSKVIYNHDEKSVEADRIGLYRKRKKLINELQESLSEDALWKCIIEHQKFLFHTASGLPFKYEIKTGRNELYTKELLIDRREESKTLAWSSVLLAFKNAKEYEGIVNRPKSLGDIRGISYIYPIFYHFGLIQVPEKVKENMDGKNATKKQKEKGSKKLPK